MECGCSLGEWMSKESFYESVHNYTKFKLVEMLINRLNDGRLNLDNVQITDNSTLNSGGGIFAQTILNSTFSNITVSNNSALESGGSIYFCCDSEVEIINSTFSNNSPQEKAFSDDALGDSISVSYSGISSFNFNTSIGYFSKFSLKNK